jgi:hypothetical protein
MKKHKKPFKLPFVVVIGSCERNSSSVWMHAIDLGLRGNCHVFVTAYAPETLYRKRLHRISTGCYNNNILDAITLGTGERGDCVAAYVLPEYGEHTMREIASLKVCKIPILYME